MKYCKGCYRRSVNFCVYTKYMKECPCGICLIKGVCQVACEEFIDFTAVRHPCILKEYASTVEAQYPITKRK